MADFAPVFAALRAIMLEAAARLPVARDAPGDLVVNAAEPDAKGKPVMFGAVAIKRSYVAYHLFPLYTDPGGGAGLSAELTRRRQGKSCFNFTGVDAALFEELRALTAAYAAG